ncbi:MAG: DUF5989 family protein [Planctomycetota bacterium]
MGFFKNFSIKLEIIKELIVFLWRRKLWWLIPIVIFLVFLGLLLILAAGSPLGPFIYPFF